jgi:hypothetical protein
MASASKDVAIRKRQKILDSSKKMFLWVAGASVVIGFSAVVSVFLVRQIMFKEKIVSEKNNTVKVLEGNIKAAPNLTDEVRLLHTNEALIKARINEQERPLQVVLDALPADNNKLALGASIQNKLVGSVSGVNIEALTVGDDVSSNKKKSAATGKATTVPFQLVISSGDVNKLKDLMKRFELSIRTINVTSITIEQGDASSTMTVRGNAYYIDPVTIQLKGKTVKPNEKK